VSKEEWVLLRAHRRLSVWARAAVATGALVFSTASAALAAAPMSPAQVAALGPLVPWQVQWLETGGASGVPGLIPSAGASQGAQGAQGGALMQLVTMVSTWTPAGFQATQTVSGSCWTGSIAAPRAGAYRCTSGNGIFDPCFAMSGGQAVACPSGNPGDERGTVIHLTAALPAGNTAQATPKHPWYFTLLDQAACGAMTGTLVSPDHTYDCLIPATGTDPQQSVYCTAPAEDGQVYTVDCAPLSAERAPNGAPQLAPGTTYKVTQMWT